MICQRIIHITKKVSTYCMLPTPHEGPCKADPWVLVAYGVTIKAQMEAQREQMMAHGMKENVVKST